MFRQVNKKSSPFPLFLFLPTIKKSFKKITLLPKNIIFQNTRLKCHAKLQFSRQLIILGQEITILYVSCRTITGFKGMLILSEKLKNIALFIRHAYTFIKG